MKPIPFIGPAYTTRSANYASSRCVNLYLEGGKGKAPAMLVGSPGLTTPWLTLASGAIRAMHVIDSDTAIVVSGGDVYNVTSAAGSTLIGSVPNDGLSAQIATDGTNYVVASGGNLYSVTLAGSTATLLVSGVSSVDYINSRFVATLTGTGDFIWSGLASTTFDTGADYETTSSAPDVIVGVRVARGTIIFLGDH